MALPVSIISSMAIESLLADLTAAFQVVSVHKVTSESAGGVEVIRRVQAGEAFDVIGLAANAIDQLIDAGRIVAGSRVDLVKSGVAAAVRAGATPVDLSAGEAVRQAVLSARSIGYSTGPSGVQLAKLFGRWGIVDQIKDRVVIAPPGVSVGTLVAAGEVELGFQQLSELMHVPGIDVLGPLPPDIQIVTTFSAGVSATCLQAGAVREMFDFMTSPAADEAKRRNGMIPMTAG